MPFEQQSPADARNAAIEAVSIEEDVCLLDRRDGRVSLAQASGRKWEAGHAGKARAAHPPL
ncbi:hypothetical protein AB4099_24525 [Bosea sp. 2KB_26]|uniref:hypothetical protein n=1 Tax=Bosea sp. 2KB_26 TaxID=3237475 RepID=UPI003F8DB20C